jgi:MoxR-like ATPase
MQMLFAATNEIPDNAELAALRDRFTLKAESRPVRAYAFDELLAKGMQNEVYKAHSQRPWANRATLDDFVKLKVYMDYIFASEVDGGSHHRTRYFPEEVYRLFVRILKALEKEFRYEVSDRKVIKLYKLIRTRAFLMHGGVVSKSDLVLLRYISDRAEDLDAMRELVDRMLSVD